MAKKKGFNPLFYFTQHFVVSVEVVSTTTVDVSAVGSESVLGVSASGTLEVQEEIKRTTPKMNNTFFIF